MEIINKKMVSSTKNNQIHIAFNTSSCDKKIIQNLAVGYSPLPDRDENNKVIMNEDGKATYLQENVKSDKNSKMILKIGLGIFYVYNSKNKAWEISCPSNTSVGDVITSHQFAKTFPVSQSQLGKFISITTEIKNILSGLEDNYIPTFQRYAMRSKDGQLVMKKDPETGELKKVRLYMATPLQSKANVKKIGKIAKEILSDW